MRHEEYEKVCQRVRQGEESNLKHIVTHQVGKIISCSEDDFFEVDVRGEHKTWSKDNVKEE